MTRKPFLVVVSGPSGAGKTTIIRELLERLPGLAFSVSATTRPPRPGEDAGKDYYFLTASEFQQKIEAGEFLESAEVYGHRYGTLRRQVEDLLAAGQDVVLDIDVQGAMQVRSAGLDAVFVFVMPPSLGHARERMDRRGTEDALSRERRLRQAPVEVAALAGYDYLICNDRKEEAVGTLAAIIRAERCRVSRLGLLGTGAASSKAGGSANGGDRCPHDEAIAGGTDAGDRQQVHPGRGRRQTGAAADDGLRQACGVRFG